MRNQSNQQSHLQTRHHRPHRKTVVKWLLWGTIGLNLTAYYFQKVLIGIEYNHETYAKFLEVWRHNNVVTDLNYILLAFLVQYSWGDVWIKVICSLFILITLLMLFYNLVYSSGSTIMNLIWLASLFTTFCLVGFIIIKSLYYRE